MEDRTLESSSRLGTLREWEQYARTPYSVASKDVVNDFYEISDATRLPSIVDVSVIVLTFNHEKWLEQCLDGIVKQETCYSFDIILSEDCSTDRTLEICKEYQRQYPNLIRLLVANKNYGGQGVGARVDLLVGAHCRYVMWCEGDDYWTDLRKIEKQVAFLEEHLDVGACAGRFDTLYLKEGRMDVGQRNLRSGYIRHVFRNGFEFFHISTICVRVEEYKRYADFRNRTGVGYDMTLLRFLQLSCGVYVLPDVFSVYRRTGEGIWSSSSQSRMRMITLRVLLNTAKNVSFPFSTYINAELIAEYCSYMRRRAGFWGDWRSLGLAFMRVVSYSLRNPLSSCYCIAYFVMPKIVVKFRRFWRRAER